MAVIEKPSSAGQGSKEDAMDSRLMDIDLSSLEAETRCAVCLGIVKNCRLVSGCMHRFCADCIEKWLRVASEPSCPQCREQMQSRRDCKRDSRFDRLLTLLYENISSYEAQVYDPSADVLQTAKKTGNALATAAAAQRAKRAGARPQQPRRPPAAPSRPATPPPPPVTADGLHAVTDGSSSYAAIAPSNTYPKVHPVLWMPQSTVQEAERMRTQSPSPMPASAGVPSRPSPGPATKGGDARGSKTPEPKQTTKQAKRAAAPKKSKQPKKQRTEQTPEPSKSEPPSSPDPAEAERTAVGQAAALAARAATAGAAEANQTTPMVEVHLHRASAMDYMVKDADITLLCPAGMTAEQLDQMLTQRHTCLRTRRIFYRISNPVQGSDLMGLNETVGSVAARMQDCRQDLHMEFVASAAGEKRG
ncbi:probable E3 ubiquitin-protein ligase RING1 at N-terminal half [Coccomyxa sp. Obi]|nr:probable E3 ubiquitin-protein ligase RING1 at N-terminal half [Coccomyxa sp. Obi]